ncbi:MAG: hypothetical protein IH956_05175 [Chloroflexi bacterium]|nr:hypothetical protein [Chloroflexota bacterium]
MAHVIVALFAIAMMITGAVTLTDASLSSASDISLAWPRMVERSGDRARTRVQLLSADIGGSGADVDISLRNSGQTALAGFSDWDTIIQYYESANNTDMRVQWLSYTTSASPSSGEWTVVGIYQDAGTQDPEVYEPNVFNPGEEMILRLNISPAIPATTDSMVKIGAHNGVTLVAPFSR